MGLFDSLRNVLGMQRPLVPRDPQAKLALTETALARLDALPEGHGLHIEVHPAERGYVVAASEGEAYGPPPPALEPWPITISDEHLQQLNGLLLDCRDGRWAVSAPLELRGRETPNPNGRLYLCDRWLAVGRPLFFTNAEELPDLAARLFDIPGVVSVLIRDNTLTLERVPETPWETIDRSVDAALRQHFLMCGQAIDGDAVPQEREGFEGEVMAVLKERIIPAIHRDGGDLQLMGISDGVAYVQLHGACRTCPASSMTLKNGVESALKEAFGDRIQRVEQVT